MDILRVRIGGHLPGFRLTALNSVGTPAINHTDYKVHAHVQDIELSADIFSIDSATATVMVGQACMQVTGPDPSLMFTLARGNEEIDSAEVALDVTPCRLELGLTQQTLGCELRLVDEGVWEATAGSSLDARVLLRDEEGHPIHANFEVIYRLDGQEKESFRLNNGSHVMSKLPVRKIIDGADHQIELVCEALRDTFTYTIRAVPGPMKFHVTYLHPQSDQAIPSLLVDYPSIKNPQCAHTGCQLGLTSMMYCRGYCDRRKTMHRACWGDQHESQDWVCPDCRKVGQHQTIYVYLVALDKNDNLTKAAEDEIPPASTHPEEIMGASGTYKWIPGDGRHPSLLGMFEVRCYGKAEEFPVLLTAGNLGASFCLRLMPGEPHSLTWTHPEEWQAGQADGDWPTITHGKQTMFGLRMEDSFENWVPFGRHKVLLTAACEINGQRVNVLSGPSELLEAPEQDDVEATKKISLVLPLPYRPLLCTGEAIVEFNARLAGNQHNIKADPQHARLMPGSTLNRDKLKIAASPWVLTGDPKKAIVNVPRQEVELEREDGRPFHAGPKPPQLNVSFKGSNENIQGVISEDKRRIVFPAHQLRWGKTGEGQCRVKVVVDEQNEGDAVPVRVQREPARLATPWVTGIVTVNEDEPLNGDVGIWLCCVDRDGHQCNRPIQKVDIQCYPMHEGPAPLVVPLKQSQAEANHLAVHFSLSTLQDNGAGTRSGSARKRPHEPVGEDVSGPCRVVFTTGQYECEMKINFVSRVRMERMSKDERNCKRQQEETAFKRQKLEHEQARRHTMAQLRAEAEATLAHLQARHTQVEQTCDVSAKELLGLERRVKSQLELFQHDRMLVQQHPSGFEAVKLENFGLKLLYSLVTIEHPQLAAAVTDDCVLGSIFFLQVVHTDREDLDPAVQEHAQRSPGGLFVARNNKRAMALANEIQGYRKGQRRQEQLSIEPDISMQGYLGFLVNIFLISSSAPADFRRNVLYPMLGGNRRMRVFGSSEALQIFRGAKPACTDPLLALPGKNGTAMYVSSSGTEMLFEVKQGPWRPSGCILKVPNKVKADSIDENDTADPMLRLLVVQRAKAKDTLERAEREKTELENQIAEAQTQVDELNPNTDDQSQDSME